MAVYKCKMCGGTLEVTDNQSVAECDYCGTKQTLPTAQDETLQKLFNRANILRMKSEFDKAAELYEKLIQMKPDEAEAYWGLILCKYGIEYVEDPKTLSRIPTCHRASFSSVVADEDYKSALSYADILQKTIYESEAKEIDRLQKEIIDISRNESPYDIFICYKETDADGKRTQDGVIANEIYHQLTAEGYKVFYASITLEDKLGTEYEPYIFAALHSARVMLVVGTKPEYFNAVWVKNEWSRYLHLLKSDRSKLLIPCYRDMDPYELPEEFAHLQAQDMSKIGFINDIVRGIRKIIKKDEAQTAKKEAVVVDSVSHSVQALLERGYMALEDGEWSRADEFFEQVLNIDPKNWKAYLGKFLVQEEKIDFDAVISAHLEDTSEANGEEVSVVNRENEDRIIRSHIVEKFLTAEQIRKLFFFDDTILSYVDSREEQLEDEREYFQNNKTLARAIQYGAEGVVDKLEYLYSVMEQRIKDAEKEEQEASDVIQQEYDDMLKEAESKADEMKMAAEDQREKKYQRACDYFGKVRTIENCKTAYALFALLGKYKKSKQYCQMVREKQKQMEEEKLEREYQEAILLANNALTIEECETANKKLEQFTDYEDAQEYIDKLLAKRSKLEKEWKKKNIIGAIIVIGLLLLLIILTFILNNSNQDDDLILTEMMIKQPFFLRVGSEYVSSIAISYIH